MVSTPPGETDAAEALPTSPVDASPWLPGLDGGGGIHCGVPGAAGAEPLGRGVVGELGRDDGLAVAVGAGADDGLVGARVVSWPAVVGARVVLWPAGVVLWPAVVGAGVVGAGVVGAGVVGPGLDSGVVGVTAAQSSAVGRV
jgi:hypothetical protein